MLRLDKQIAKYGVAQVYFTLLSILLVVILFKLS